MYISISTLCPRNLSPSFFRLGRISGPRFRPPAANPKWCPQKWSPRGSIFGSCKTGCHTWSAPSARNWTTLGGQIRCPNFGSAWSVDLAAGIRHPKSRKGLPPTSRRTHVFFFLKWCEKSSKLVQKKTKMDQKKFRIDTGQIQEMLIFPLEFNDFRPRACPSCSAVLAQKFQKACEKKSKVVADFSPERRRFGRKWPARPGRSDRRSRAPALVAPRSAGRLRWALRFASGPAPQLCSAGCLFCWGCNIWPATRIQGQRICKGYFFSKAFPHASSRFLKIRRFISGAQCGNRAVRKRCHPAFDFILRYLSDTVVACGGLR